MKHSKPGSGGDAGPDTKWDEIRRRLDLARDSHGHSGEMTLKEKQIALKRRAKALAIKSKEEKDSEASIEVVEFLLAHERYAFELSCASEVYSFKDCTNVPCTPPFVVGVINIRSRILSVVDLKDFFELPKQRATEHSKVIILSNDDMEFGILVDELLGINSIGVKDIQPSLPTLTGLRALYLKGVSAGGLVLLDGMRILQDKRIVVHQEVE